MVEAVSFLVFGTTAGFSVGGVALTTGAGALTIAGSLVNLAGSALLNYALRPDQPKAARPENIQVTSKVATAPRLVVVGRARVGGNVVFHRAVGGVSYRVICHAHGGVSEVEAILLNNKIVDVWKTGDPPRYWTNDDNDAPAPVLDEFGKPSSTAYMNGEVTDLQYLRGAPAVRILSRQGAVPSAHYPELTAVFPEWTASHRLDGQASSLIICKQVRAKHFQRVYPKGEPDVAKIFKGVPVFDPRDDSTGFSENAALIIRHLIASPDGMNAPDALDPDNIAAQADIADLQVPLPDLSTEAKWRLGGVWSLSEKPQAPLQRMLDACAGRIYLRPDGKAALFLGQPAAPTVTLTFSDLIELQEITHGADRVSRYNVLPARYVDHGLRFVEVDAEAWEDTARQALDGEEVGPALDLSMAPSHRQARAAMKDRFHRDNPSLMLRAVFKPRAQLAVYEKDVTLDLSPLGIAGDFDVTGWNLHFSGQSGLLEAVSLSLSAIDPDRSSLPVGEHGLPQSLPAPTESGGVPLVTGVVAAGQGFQSAANTWVAGISVAWDAPPSLALRPIVEYLLDGSTSWQEWPVSDDARGTLIAPLRAGGDYTVGVSWQTPEGERGLRALVEDVTAIASTTVPLPPTGLTVVDEGGGQARVTVTASASEDQWRTIVYRDAVEVGRLTSFASETVEFLDAPGTGSFTWTAVALNVSEIRSDANDPADIAGPVTETIT
ncbi:hypothetical protein [Ponticoccus alexandrii]|uniref:Fibronectin type-III domain-containing protein n=1 Tax=Ponticoccus alexandrii TaxID=1943633 RepID=A0ABX7F7N6_9RHOB|nr:hypothetical protein [Ponticoccus alexandrii]ETA53953.1 hypothetical protein P279_00420 [Rhodobacteraceae bacterium PD-2]QRF66388.1 hypothetical protein GQA70_08735 [Ponticoccus alexandrii]